MTLAVKKQEKCIPTFFARLICLNTFVSELIKIWHIFAFLAAAAAAVRLGQVKVGYSPTFVDKNYRGRPIILNCGRISLIVIMCNVAACSD